MPNINGAYLTAELRKSRPEVPIILCTSDSSDSTECSQRFINVDLVIYKPFTPDELYNGIRKFLDLGVSRPLKGS